jgi:aspartate aminotransferase
MSPQPHSDDALTLSPAHRLARARGILAGIDAGGRVLYDGIEATHVLSLAHGNGTRRPHPDVLAAAVSACRSNSGWSFDDYHPRRRHAPLEDAIRRDLHTASADFSARAALCVGAGTAQLVSAFLAVRARPGDALLVLRPHYHGVIDWCTAADVEPVVVRTTRATAYKGTPDDLDRAAAQTTDPSRRIRAVLLANPTFTGALYDGAELTALHHWASCRGIPLLVDSAFRHTEFPGQPSAICCPPAADPTGLLVFGGFSKAHNLANLRVGWVAGDRAIVGDIEIHRDQTLGSVPFLNQAMAAAALGAPRDYLRANAAECAVRADLILQWVAAVNAEFADQASPLIRVEHAPAAGHAILLSVNAMTGPGLRTSLDLCVDLLHRHRVAVSPAFSHGFDHLEFRLAFASIGLRATYASSRSIEDEALAGATAAYDSPPIFADPFAVGRDRLREALVRLRAGLARLLDDDSHKAARAKGHTDRSRAVPDGAGP